MPPMSQVLLHLKYKVMKNLEEMRQGKASKKLPHITAAHESVNLGYFLLIKLSYG